MVLCSTMLATGAMIAMGGRVQDLASSLAKLDSGCVCVVL